MLFPTLDFALFFLVVFLTAWSLHRSDKLHKYFLLAASYFFYGYWDWRFLGLLVLSSLINYTAGNLLVQAASTRKRAIIAITVALNLGILGIFKYHGFFVESVSDLLRAVSLERDLPLLDIILPIGISFFTFQGISYAIDVSRGDLDPVEDPLDLFLYISFFPQLVAGPIVRAADFLPQLRRPPTLSHEMVAFGFLLIVMGLFKKTIVASYLATGIVDDAFSYPAALSSLDLLFAAYAFVVQIYCDFSGYSDIAIGVAALLGYRFRRNFDRPLAATTLQDLWQRWHISLTSWLRDYLYRPLRGNKRGQAHMFRNLFLTMLIAGLWHGAAWTFVIWGGLQGAMLVIERIVRAQWNAWAGGAKQASTGRKTFSAAFGWFVTFNAFAISAIYFRAEDLTVVSEYFGQLLVFDLSVQRTTPFVFLLIAGSVAVQFLPSELPTRIARWLQAPAPVLMGLGVGAALLAMEMLGQPGVAPFIYFQF